MNRVVIDLEALRDNFAFLQKMMKRHNAMWTIVTKSLCGNKDVISALNTLGANGFADSRLDNLRAINSVCPDSEKWYLRLPHLSAITDVVKLSDVSLNTEKEVICALSREAVRQNKIHRILIMIELGDLREGILPGTLIDFYETTFNLPNIEVLGLGTQFGCLTGVVPNLDQLAQILLYRELLELKFNRKLPVVSAGSSILLSLLLRGNLPKGINHFRIGESLFLGTDLVDGGTIPGLRDDVVFLEAEIAEIKKKSLTPSGDITNAAPFDGVVDDNTILPGQRGYRALVTIGQIDTDIAGITPVNKNYQVAGASSDITVVNLGDKDDGLRIGDTIQFKVSYSAFVRLMNDPYIRKEVSPNLEEFQAK